MNSFRAARASSLHSRRFFNGNSKVHWSRSPSWKAREKAKGGGAGKGGRDGEERGWNVFCIFSSPPPPLFYTHQPLPWYQFLTHPKSLVVLTSKMAGKRNFWKKKRVMDRAAKYACFAGYASRASLTRPRPRPRASSLALCFQPRSWPFVWLFARTWIRKNTDCFAVEKLSIQIMAKNVVRSCESASNVHGLTCREDLKEA